MSFTFKLPEYTVYGENALRDSEMLIKKFGKKALIVTGKIVTKTGLTDKLVEFLNSWEIDYEIFNDIPGEPTVEMIEEGVETFQKAECDFIIGFGGGSPLDSAKAIAAMSVLPGNISDYLGKEISGEFPPMVLIPTTAGTGSEATKFTIITDSEKNIKMLLKGDDLIPNLAILDSTLTYTAPKSITAATGMDALTHAIESFTSRKGNPFTDVYALSAIKRIFKYLPIAYDEAENKVAREEMAIAAYEAGVCINNASVTLVHGMSRPIGALFHVPHGISNAMLITKCLEYVIEGCFEKFEEMAKSIGITGYENSEQAANMFLERLESLCRHLEIPYLEEYGIDRQEFFKSVDKMATDAMASGSPGNTIKQVNKEDLVNIYYQLWN